MAAKSFKCPYCKDVFDVPASIAAKGGVMSCPNEACRKEMTISPISTGQSKASMIRSVIRHHDEEVKAGLMWNIETKETLLNPVVVSEELLKSYAGVYGPRTIIFENGALYYQRENRPRFRMIPMADALFCFDEIDYFRIKVNVDAEGNPTELVGTYSGGRTDVSPIGPGN